MRSHAGGTGEMMTPELARAMLLVRLNQLAAGRSGAHPRLLTALADALTNGAVPLVHRTGSIGTGDLTALAETGLTLAGERPWASGDLAAVPFDTGDAMAFKAATRRPLRRPCSLVSRSVGCCAQATRSRRCPSSPWTAHPRRTRRQCTRPARIRARWSARRRCAGCSACSRCPRRVGGSRILTACVRSRRCRARPWTPAATCGRCSRSRSTQAPKTRWCRSTPTTCSTMRTSTPPTSPSHWTGAGDRAPRGGALRRPSRRPGRADAHRAAGISRHRTAQAVPG